MTYRDGRPAGIQWVTLQPNGVFQVGTYVRAALPELGAERDRAARPLTRRRR